MAANLVSSPAPAYPAQASAARVQGEVIIEAVVGKDGSVVDTRVVSGPPMLRDAALNAVQRWRYRPFEVDGKPSEIATTARVDFHLGPE
jgi:TonB family protein